MGEDDKNKIYWVLGVIIGSVGLNQGINKGFSEVRYDSFTGAQGAVLRKDLRELEREVDMIDREQWRMIDRMKNREVEAGKCREQLDGHFRNHP